MSVEFLTLEEAKLLFDTFNTSTKAQAEKMDKAHHYAKEVYANQLRDMLLLVKDPTERSKLATYMQKRMVQL